ncbi:hypothetical protein CFIMG_000638RA [Ceratocystis fimbriata CBS 114723]|uniref:DNA damage-responsive protein 48 n=1 Tax=Ceratocystis fimbriata CBS 114723 TaxID=1035309 RepID=A0A2C5XBE4_9PEZI|nr:hypothetical protein CFIMG_000638RA [Ceratocystis fimbriata CBS 114723]
MNFSKLTAQAKNALSGSQENKNAEGQNSNNNNKDSSTSGFGGLTSMLNNAAGGGAKGEKNEDMLDKGIDAFQEHVLGQGQQSNETAAEQAKDEAIAGFIRKQYKNSTGNDFPIKDKERSYGL